MSKVIFFLKNQDKITVLSLAFALFTSLLICTVFLFFYNLLPPKLPLFYSLSWGESQLAAKNQFLILPAILTLIALVNAFLSYQLHPAHLILKRIIMGSLILISLIMLITALKIIIIFI